ncbi:hypothetical protein E1B28_008038 [Marasmius oreades]|uniref:Ribosomal RNA methyltransferase FtsJ domain-containing protein n=2 Tax=Marasmius oreades TaxID=181124 RepID=A0A9P7UVJ5_9AGAR|nr:uncharacterized protein E1B28_008038 [Marasmius oreades]KAG7094441.1 hypothetical protein E1B28_008038 [Marasmius oreades]
MNVHLPLKSKELKTLHRLRSLKHVPALAAHFAHQQRQADSQDPEIQRAWFNAMKDVFEEINEIFWCVPFTTPFQFLDVGCCPGGFSSYILSRYPLANGTGMSLPVEKGGHKLLLEEDFHTRFNLIWADITLFELGNRLVHNHGPNTFTATFPFAPDHGGFDLIILDGHPLRTQAIGDSEDVHILGDRLIISSLILGMFCIKNGGTIMMKLSMPDRKITAQIMYLFDMLSGDLRTWKPVNIHAIQSTFYVIARDFGGGMMAGRYWYVLTGLRDLWERLVVGEQNGRLRHDDLDFVVDRRGLKAYSGRLEELSRHLWDVEAQSLLQWHEARENGF